MNRFKPFVLLDIFVTLPLFAFATRETFRNWPGVVCSGLRFGRHVPLARLPCGLEVASLRGFALYSIVSATSGHDVVPHDFRLG